jgi:DNA polymerase-3 subunit delta
MARRSGSTRKKTLSKKSVTLTTDHRLVLLKGKERFLISLHTESLIERLRAAHGDVEVRRYDGETDEPSEILDECRSFGLLSAHKVIVVRNADEAVKGDNRPLFERYAQSPTEGATLILQATSWHPGKLDKLIEKDGHGAIKACEEVTEPQAMKWASDRARARHGGELEKEAAEELVARTGPDLGRIDAELGKLVSAAGEGMAVSRALVAEMVELSREQAVWLIQGALASGDRVRALEKLHELMEVSGIDPVPMRYFYSDVARKVHQYARAKESGMAANQAMRQAKMFGDGVREMTSLADAIGSAGAKRLLAACVNADVRGKTGQGDVVRGLEMLTLEFAEAQARH